MPSADHKDSEVIWGKWGSGKTNTNLLKLIADDLRSDKSYLRKDNELLREEKQRAQSTIDGLRRENVSLQRRLQLFQTQQAAMLQEMRKEIQSLLHENKQLREEIQRDRDQDSTKDTG